METSKKGKYVVDLVFSDLDVLYTLAIDSYHPESFREFIRVHSNKIYEETNYASSAIITSFLFLLFIVYSHNEEMKKYVKVNIIPNIQKEIFVLPVDKHLSVLLRRAYQLYKVVDTDEK